MIRVLRRAVIGFVIACVVWFMFANPEAAAGVVRSAVGGIATAIDSGSRFLAGLANG